MGMVEMDLADLVDASNKSDGSFQRRNDPVKADNPGMKASGTLEWSARFCPLWQMPLDEMNRRLEAKNDAKKYEPEDTQPPWYMQWVKALFEEFIEDKPDWEHNRDRRRKETLAWFTGEKERDEMEAASKPSNDFRSGILQFHIHQCTGELFVSTSR